MKKIVLKVAAVGLFMSGFLAVNAKTANQVGTCNNPDPILAGECSNQGDIPCCVTSNGTPFFTAGV